VVGVVIAEDNPGVREGLVAMLNSTPGLRVVGECEDGDEVLAVVERTHPDVVAMDVGMPRMDGLEATRQLLTARPTARVLILTASLTTALVRAARDAGAAGYQLKGDDPAELVEAIRAVARGEPGWSKQAAAHLSGP
jgi:DNA-binding NarL/FixJ family response regulator